MAGFFPWKVSVNFGDDIGDTEMVWNWNPNRAKTVAKFQFSSEIKGALIVRFGIAKVNGICIRIA